MNWFPDTEPLQGGAEPYQQRETEAPQTKTQQLLQALALASLPAPQASPQPETQSQTQPMEPVDSESSGTTKDWEDAVNTAETVVKIAAAAAEEDDDDVGDLLCETDEDEEDDSFCKTPVPRLIARKLEDNGNGNNNSDDDDDANDLSWVDVPPPPALADVVAHFDPLLHDLDPLLRSLVVPSIESVQQQGSQARAAQVAKAAAVAQAAAEAEAEERRRGKQVAVLAAQQEGEEYARNAHDSRNSSSFDQTWVMPLPPLSTVAGKRPSRRQVLTSRLKRHVHVFSTGAGPDAGESSAAGAAAGAALAVLSPVGMAGGSSTGKGWASVSMLPRRGSASVAAPMLAAAQPALPPDDKKRAVILLTKMRKGQEMKGPEMVECISCFDEVSIKKSVKTVCHSYCFNCFRQLVDNALRNEAQFPPKCCLNEVPAKTVLRYVPDDIGRRYTAKVAELRVPVSERFYCPTADCGLFVPPKYIARAARVARCRSGHESCTLCRQPAHGAGAGPCPEDRDQQMADDLAATEGWRRCITCGVIVEHREFCQHMTCRCGAQFCYVCGAPWRNCDCDMDDLNRLKATAVDRRRAREEQEERARAAAEHADSELQELREALHLVAEYEKAAAHRRATRRRRLHRRLLRLRDRRTRQLQLEIADKYIHLRAALADLNWLHQTAARTDRRVALVNLVKEAATERASLRADRARARTAAAATVANAEAAWKRDYAARVRLERGLEAAYRAQMEADPVLWAKTAAEAATPADGAADRAALIDAAVAAYQRTNDARCDAYVAWQARELAMTRHVADEEQAVRCEELGRAALQLRARQAADRAELLRRHAAERVWCQAVAAERGRMLDEMEAAETELGLAGSGYDHDATLLMLLEIVDTAISRHGGDDVGSGSDIGDPADNSNEEEEQMVLFELSARTLFEDAGFDEDDGDDTDDGNEEAGGSGGGSGGGNGFDSNSWDDSNPWDDRYGRSVLGGPGSWPVHV